VEPIRVWIEGFLRGRYGYEGNRALWVLVAPALVGAILVVMVWQTSVDRNDVVRACGREVLPEYRHLPEYRDLATDFAEGMRLDCGIYGLQAAGKGD
jgi:hypothetical protein